MEFPNAAIINSAREREEKTRTALESQRASLAHAEQAKQSISSALKLVSDTSVSNAMSAAELAVTQVASAVQTSQRDLEAAKRALAEALEPGRVFREIGFLLERTLRTNCGGEAVAGCSARLLELACAGVADIKGKNESVVAAENNAESLERERQAQSARVDQLEQSLRHLKNAHEHIDAAETATAIAQLQETVEQAVDERNSLVIESVAANLKMQALVAAQPGLESAIRLQVLLQSLDSAAQSEYQRFLRERDEERASAESSVRSNCTCSETNCPCTYCWMEQQAVAGGHRRETSMSD